MIEIFTTKSSILTGVVTAISFLLTLVGLLPTDPQIIAITENGQVQGRVDYSRNGSKFLSFLGIPFAEPPVGELRFEAPRPLGRVWKGVKQTTNYSPRCLQSDTMLTWRVIGQEDCLYLNVFTNGTEGKRPVMVYIHGGGFVCGASKMYQPHFFMDHAHEIVFVTLNYRLGPLGFMNTGDGLIHGNMGLKDQLMALKWVQRNIDKFGGDSSKITLFGESAGAASVGYHLISPRSKGMFHRAILQSGSVTCPWSFRKNPKEVSMKYIEMLPCRLENKTELLHCLKTIDPVELVKLQAHLVHHPTEFFIFVPSVELDTEQDAFLTKDPNELLKSGKIANKVPTMFGVLSGEGALRTARYDAIPEAIEEIDKNWDALASKILMYDKHEDQYHHAAETIRKLYFGNNSFTEDFHGFKKNFSKLASDALFFEPIGRAAKYHAAQGPPTYFYYYDYKSAIFPNMYSMFRAVRNDDWLFSEVKIASAILVDGFKDIFNLEGPHEFGETHANDLFQLWNMEGLSALFAGLDTDFSRKFVKSFVDFALNEEPLKFSDVPWPPILSTQKTMSDSLEKSVAPLEIPSMVLRKEPRVVNGPFSERISFWERLRSEDLQL